LLISCRNTSHKTALPEAVLGIQETDAENLPCLLRRGHNPAESDCHNDSKSPRQFSILDFGLSEYGLETLFEEPAFIRFSLIENPKFIE